MKKIFLIVLIGLLFSCKKEEQIVKQPTEPKDITLELGKDIFEGKGMCATCHKPDEKVIAPSLKEIAVIYTQKKANMVLFLQGELDPIVDPAQYEIMKANLAITKTMTEEELQALEEYILTFK